MSTPHIGQMVIFHPPLEQDRSTRPDCPAVIQALHSGGWVKLWVFGPLDVWMPLLASEGLEPGEWSEQ